MTNVKCTCPDCGDVTVTIDKVVLRLFDGRQDQDGEYRFRCPQCRKIVLKPAPVNIINLLYSSGVLTEVVELPLELLERPRDEDAAPISMDDIIDLGLALQDDEEWMRRLLSGDE